MLRLKNNSLDSLFADRDTGDGKVGSLPPINYIDDYSLKSVGKIQKMFIHLWKGESTGM
jgi:hypothetical protein